MIIVLLILYLLALVACVVATKVWLRAVVVIIMGIMTFGMCLAIIEAQKVVPSKFFWDHHKVPLQAFLSAVRSDVSIGANNAAIAKLDIVLRQSHAFNIYSTNVTLRTINQELGISEHHFGQVLPEPAPSAAPDEPSR